jgi:hypothetical protein
MVVVEGWVESVLKADLLVLAEGTLVAEADLPQTGLGRKTWRAVENIAMTSDGGRD